MMEGPVNSRSVRYERQGILVDAAALARAEEECLDDADVRAIRQQRDAMRRAELDAAYVNTFAEATRRLYPSAPEGIERVIAEHACERYSRRIGRTAAAKDFDPAAIDLAVQAHIRHCYTRYDDLLAGGTDRGDARATVRREVDRILGQWRTGT